MALGRQLHGSSGLRIHDFVPFPFSPKLPVLLLKALYIYARAPFRLPCTNNAADCMFLKREAIDPDVLCTVTLSPPTPEGPAQLSPK